MFCYTPLNIVIIKILVKFIEHYIDVINKHLIFCFWVNKASLTFLCLHIIIINKVLSIWIKGVISWHSPRINLYYKILNFSRFIHKCDTSKSLIPLPLSLLKLIKHLDGLYNFLHVFFQQQRNETTYNGSLTTWNVGTQRLWRHCVK